MASTQSSRRDVFRAIATDSYREWPAYDTTQLYDWSSLGTLKEEIGTVVSVWFAHKAHNSVDEFICKLPLQYVDLTPHDQYNEPATYEMRTLVLAFLLKEAYGWDHETALLKHLKNRPSIQQQHGFETVPDQSTLWRTWHCRFPPDLRETIQKSARLLLINANREGSDVPRDPFHDSESHEETSPTDYEVLTHAAEITEQVSHIVYPAFSLNRGDSCEIHPNAFWDLQTYLGLRENLAANEGVRSFLYDSQRDRTPLGHAHRDHIRGLSIESVREMYHEALQRLLDRVSETEVFHRAGLVAIDMTEAKPFTGDRTGHEDEILGTKDGKYAYQWATVQLVGKAVPLVLDARPIRKGESRRKIVEDLLDSAQDLVHVDRVLMDRAFDSQHILEEIDQRGLGMLFQSGYTRANELKQSVYSGGIRIATLLTGNCTWGRMNGMRPP